MPYSGYSATPSRVKYSAIDLSESVTFTVVDVIVCNDLAVPHRTLLLDPRPHSESTVYGLTRSGNSRILELTAALAHTSTCDRSQQSPIEPDGARTKLFGTQGGTVRGPSRCKEARSVAVLTSQLGKTTQTPSRSLCVSSSWLPPPVQPRLSDTSVASCGQS